jgi:predicted AAA+ superfamily ATPase
MRYFNTSGPCNPAEHYTVLRKELIAQGLEKVHQGRYLTIFAPRQAGKTTYFQQGKRQLAEYLKTEGLEAGYYVVFSKKHAEDDVLEEEEVIDGKRIVTRIIRVNFERPSRRKKKKK